MELSRNNSIRLRQHMLLDELKIGNAREKTVNTNVTIRRLFSSDRDSHEKNVKHCKNDSIYEALKSHLLIGQIVGILPLQGILGSDPRDLRFSWISMASLYCLVSLVTYTIVSEIMLYQNLAATDLSLIKLVDILDYNFYLLELVIFWRQAQTWPTLMTEWTKLDDGMKTFQQHFGIKKRIKIIIWTHFAGVSLSIAFTIIERTIEFMKCSKHFWHLFQLIITSIHPIYFTCLDNFVLGKYVIIVFMFVQHNVVLIYDELTIIVVSYPLYLNFRSFNQRLFRLQNQKMPISYWAEMRETYSQLAQFTRLLDTHLAFLTFFCFSGNIYRSCSSLRHAISSRGFHSMSLIYSVCFELTRTFIAALMASMVHEESKKPLTVLFSLPTDCYNVEVSRLQTQVAQDTIIITGYRFFSVNRGYIMTAAGMIITFEVMMLQFKPLGSFFNQSVHNCSLVD